MFYMSLGGRIALIATLSIVGVWILLLIVNLIFVGSFSSIFKKHKEAIPVILYTKMENIKALISILNQFGLDIDNRLVVILNDIGAHDFDNPGTPQFEKSVNTLSYLKDELFFLASQHPELGDDPDFMLVKQNLIDSDNHYRNTITMYNADVLGYNYWIRFLPCRFIFQIFRVKKKEIIS